MKNVRQADICKYYPPVSLLFWGSAPRKDLAASSQNSTDLEPLLRITSEFRDCCGGVGEALLCPGTNCQHLRATSRDMDPKLGSATTAGFVAPSSAAQPSSCGWT